MTKRSGIKHVVVKHSELFGENIDVDRYVDVDDLEGKEVSAYRVTPDYGNDIVASVNDGYTIMPSVY
jgi:hypothetical protein